MLAFGSSMTSEGVSSPPRVRAVPVKRDAGPRGSSPPGLCVFLRRASVEALGDL